MSRPAPEAELAIPVESVDVGGPELTALRRARARGPVAGRVALLGPAFVAAVAYVDPGNFATNITGGAKYGYMLVWVIVMANLMAMLVQYLSAKAGIVSGKNLPELCREAYPRRASFMLWMQAEVIAMATDVAEFMGAALGLYLLFGVPMFAAGVITAIIAFGILALEQRGYRKFELAIIGLIGIVFLGFIYDFFAVGNQSAAAIFSGLKPRLTDRESVMLAVGIIGATVMPHVVYLHSALTQRRIEPQTDKERRELLRYTRFDVMLGLGLAGIINLSMLCIAAALFFGTGHNGVDTIGAMHDQLGVLVGGGAALAFGVALLASGLSSSSVGTYAGQVVMQGFIAMRIPLLLRRAITMTPALLLLASGVSTDRALVLSQVILSFGIPFALVPLILVTRRRDLMGDFVNRRLTTGTASVVAALIIGLNLFLLEQTFFG